MDKSGSKINYFSRGELILWASSLLLITAFFFIFDRSGYISLAASLIGATSLIFNAKGNPAGQALMIAFGIIYGYISYSYSYYGEMITYLGMTVPMAVVALISWLRNPYRGKRSEVRVSRLKCGEVVFMIALTAAVTLAFYFPLKLWGTANPIISTVSVTTSFAAVYLTFRRSEYFALAYAANDIVLIILWGLASVSDRSYLSVVICFVIFLANDIYGFISWKKMKKRQSAQA